MTFCKKDNVLFGERHSEQGGTLHGVTFYMEGHSAQEVMKVFEVAVLRPAVSLTVPVIKRLIKWAWRVGSPITYQKSFPLLTVMTSEQNAR